MSTKKAKGASAPREVEKNREILTKRELDFAVSIVVIAASDELMSGQYFKIGLSDFLKELEVAKTWSKHLKGRATPEQEQQIAKKCAVSALKFLASTVKSG